MYRASKALSVPQARDYYQKEYSRGDYYEHDTLERKGEWHGKGADRLELRGEVSRADFHALLEGKGPDGVQLVAAEASTDKHRAGWDFTCSADKSVSLMAVVEGDEGVRQAHRLAVDRSLDELERYVQTKDRFRDRQTTGEMVAAKFEHESSRALDPQLHTHVVVMNATRRADGQWRALEPREMFAAQRLVTATYRTELARELTRLGYGVEVRADGSVGIAGFTKGQLDHFSQRRAQIEAYLTKHGVGGAGHAERAARTTRRAKVKDIDRDSVVSAWRARAKEQGLDLAGLRARAREASPERYAELLRSAPDQAGRSVTHAIDHVTERKAVFHGRELDTEALRHGMGRVTLAEVRQASAGDGSLITCPGREVPSGRFTTQETLREEQKTVGFMKSGQGAGSPILDSSAHRFTQLSPEQERVARYILTARDQVIAVEGKAGTGKTTLLREVRPAAEGAGWRVRGFAPTTGAVKLLDEAGIESATVASLKKEAVAQGTRRELWIVDEAGMLSTRQAAAVLSRAQEQGARVVLLGDSRQHAAVESGRPFDYLAQHGMKVEQLGEIRRQTNEVLRAAVKDAAEGRVRQAVSRLEGAERVIEVKDPLARHRAIADEVARHADKRTLVVAPSNEERQQINRLVRERLIADGRVEKASLKVDITTGKGLTGPELKVARNYEPGDHVRFNRGAQTLGLDAGAEGRVLSADPRTNRVTVQLQDGPRIEYDPRTVTGASVAKVEERRLAVGDRVQFRAPDRAQRIPNGQLGTLRELDSVGRSATVELDSGRRVTLDLRRPQSLDYGYASTSHAAQGQTVDRVLVTIDTERSAALVNQKQFYVSISRAREDAVIFTDSRKDLARAVSREADKPSALDYVNRGEERRHGDRPEPRREHGARGAKRMGHEPAAGTQPERGDTGRAAAGPRAAAAPDRRGEDAGRAPGRADATGHHSPRTAGDGAAGAERVAGARDHGGPGEPGAALGGHRGAVSDARGRSGPEPERGRTGPLVHAAEGGRGRDDRGRGARVGADAVPGHSEDARGHEPHSGQRGQGRARSGPGVEGRTAEDSALSPLARLRIRDEEHRALQGLLPPDLARAAGKLNAAARELGVARIVTPERVKQLGETAIRGVVSLVDPKKAALAIGRALVTRLVQGAERER